MELLAPASDRRPAPCLACGATPCTVPVHAVEGGPITGALCDVCTRRLVALRAIAEDAPAPRRCGGRHRAVALAGRGARRPACR